MRHARQRTGDRSRCRGRADGAADRAGDPGRRRHSRRQPVGHEDRRQARRIAGDGGGSRRRPDHRRRPGAAGCPRYRRCPRSASIWRSRRTRQLLPDRSARRHQGIRRRPQRIHGQSRAGDQRHAAARHHRRAGARVGVARAWSGRGAERLRRRRIGRCERPSRSGPAACPPPANPGSWPSAARMAMPGPKPLSTAGPARSAQSSDRRSNSAGSRRAAPISIPASPRPANGTSRRATPSSPRPAARSRIRKGADVAIRLRAARISSCRNSSPGAIAAAGIRTSIDLMMAAA